MFSNYLKIAFRQFWRHRLFSLLNVGGLAIGLAAFLLIVQYVWFERSFDRQSPHAPYIWRVYTENYVNGTLETRDANTHSAIGPTLQRELPEVVDYARIYSARDLTGFRGQTPYREEKAYAVDEGFLRLFPYRVRAGQSRHALDRPNTVVLTASTARRYFGAQNPVGKSLRLVGGWFTGLHTVTAVVDDPPLNTHFKFDLLLSYRTLYSQGHADNWENYWDYNYFQLRPDADPARVEAKLGELSDRHLAKSNLRLRMQRLTDIHLHSDLTYEHEPNGSARAVYFLMAIGLLILGLAWVNYSNLTTARSLTRAKEVGLRKTIGAGRGQLVAQFMGEALLMNALALLLALVLVQSTGTWFDSLTGRPLSTSGFGQSSTFYLTLAAVFAASVLGSGLYPSLVLSGYRPAWSLRGLPGGRSQRRWSLRGALVVGQLVGTVVMLVATITVYRQLRFMEQHDLGLRIDQMLVVKAPRLDYRQDSLAGRQFAVFREEATRLPGIRQLTTSSVVPGDGINQIGGSSSGLYWKKRITTDKQTFYFVNIDDQFLRTYGIRQLAGQGLRAEQPDWRRYCLINRSALRALGFPSAEAAVGESLVMGGEEERRSELEVVGVIDDFHIESLKQPTRPTLYWCAPPSRMGYFSFRLDGQRIASSVAELETLWRRLYPESPFNYFFLDQQFDQQYRAERRFSQLFGLFTGLAIVVACLGLFGLAAFAAEQRTREIGVRKVMGASVLSLVALLSKDLLKLVGLAILIASPLAWYGMHRWLADFAYKIELDGWMFVLAGGLTGLVALLTVSFQAVKAALMNPVESLRASD